ncbi:hypothetical protein [Roseomonas populi]|uniref:DUF4175 domain-containing protein n=1 Tax=Roseomonas populi TaxID=3121582 RepID=A0ABT1WYR7_9PROT|nr:hypothetical protein [Roseomonas pecuniae]MCR0980969.1 hypothetical protein [Roseomonas pecuniae]
MTPQLVAGAVAMIGVLALILNLTIVQAIYLFALSYVLFAAGAAATTLLIRWAIKLFLTPALRVTAALIGSLALHGLAWWDGWNPLAGLAPDAGPAAVAGTLLIAHAPVAILLLRNLPDAAPPAVPPSR